ncbi:MAG: DedA family protein [Candidatus Binataceae bacterium]
MASLASAYIQHFTYLGLFVVLMLCGLGLPMPEDVALLAGGYLVHRGITRYPMTLLVSLLGVVAGDTALFFAGRNFGTGLVRYFGVAKPGRQSQIERLREFLDRHGHRAIFYGRFLAGFRALIYLTAGSFGVRPAVFLAYDSAGALISVPIVVTLGYLFGRQIEQAIRYLGGFEKIVWIVLLLCAGFYGMRMLAPEAANENKPKG